MSSSLIVGLLFGAVQAAPLDERSFERWREFLKPRKEETQFQEIPWRADLWTALQEAKAKDKPILLWTMDGHPLGCT